jgi:hypothetical protein
VARDAGFLSRVVRASLAAGSTVRAVKIPRLLRALVVLAALLVGSSLGGSASARSLLASSLVEHWDGNSWTQVAVPSTGAALGVVVAPSASEVWAFGTSEIALHWDGTSWHRVTMPIPKHSAAPSFWGAAAVSTDDVWAVGSVAPAHAPEHAIIDHWNGRRWQLVPGPPPRSELYGVAALSATDVWAVGAASVSTPQGFERLALTLHWNGRAWKQVPTPNPAPTTPVMHVGNGLSAVSGSSSRDVWAVGQYNLWANGIHGSRALVLHWDGARWKLVPSPSIVAGHVSWLNGVAAPSATGAWAVGGVNNHNARHALVERWNGQRWSVVRINSPVLSGASALAPNDAWAAGGSYAGPGRIMHWNGHLWTLATKLGTRHSLAAVAEVSPTDVWAVGGQFTH